MTAKEDNLWKEVRMDEKMFGSKGLARLLLWPEIDRRKRCVNGDSVRIKTAAKCHLHASFNIRAPKSRTAGTYLSFLKGNQVDGCRLLSS